MGKELTEEQYLLLSQFAYANITDTPEQANYYKDMSFGEIIDELSTREFKDNGGITNKEFHNIMDKISQDPQLSSLTLNGYENNNKSGNYDGFVGYSFGDAEGNSYFSFRGSESNTPEGQTQGHFGIDWIDNATMGIQGKSLQFDDINKFLDKYGTGQIYVTGHSKGGANALYACASRNGVTGVAFDAPGIDQALSSEEIGILIKSGVVNCIIDDDVVGPLLFHSEKRKFCKATPEF